MSTNFSPARGLSILTVNITGITRLHKILALSDFLKFGGFDIVFLQEVNAPVLHNVAGYDVIYNIDIDSDTKCGTAILHKPALVPEAVHLLPNGRAIALDVLGVRLLNVYAPSGGSKIRARAAFFNTEVTPLLATTRPIILGGDFNCVTAAADQVPTPSMCAELIDMLSAKDLHDTWRYFNPRTTQFTYVYRTGASRLDRIYVSRSMSAKLLSVQVHHVAFSDHAAFSCVLQLDPPRERRPPRCWKFNTVHLESQDLRLLVLEKWRECLLKENNFPSAIAWWTGYVKPQLRSAIKQYCREANYWKRRTLDFYQQCLQDAAVLPVGPDDNLRLRLNRVKAKILRYHRERARGVVIRSRPECLIADEDPATYHLARERRRALSQLTVDLVTDDGVHLTTREDVVSHVTGHFAALFDQLEPDADATSDLLADIVATLDESDRDELGEHLSTDDVEAILKKCPTAKSPGPDGLPYEFYRAFWDIFGGKFTQMVNEVLGGLSIPGVFLEGRVVLIPKIQGQCKITDLRPITLLNTDYKLLARCIACKLKSVMDKIVSPYQSCGGSKRNIFHAAAAYRDAVAYTATLDREAAILSVDFANAFDRISHQYLWSVMLKMGFGERFLRVILNMLSGATSVITINGWPTPPIPIRRSVRQGCPMSMFLFAIAVDPLLRVLGHFLGGIEIHTARLACIAYADDVGIFIRRSEDIDLAFTVLQTYERASGAAINSRKTVLLPIGTRGLTTRRPWYRVVDDHKILGLNVVACPYRMQAMTWRRILGTIKGVCQQHAHRHLNLLEKAVLINTSILSKAWYVAQVLPVPKLLARSISKAVYWLLWRHAIFKVSQATCVLGRMEGGLGLVDFPRKCVALLLHRTATLRARTPSGTTAAILTQYRPWLERAPIDVREIPYKLPFVREYFFARSYVLDVARDRHRTVSRLYDALLGQPPVHKLEMRQPTVNWGQVWQNISHPALSTDVSATWYLLVNDTLATNQRLANIRLRTSAACEHCPAPDTREHRFLCHHVSQVWDLCRGMVALLHGTTPAAVPVSWVLTPDVKSFPRAKHNTTLWLLGHTVYAVIGLKLTNSIPYLAYLWDQHLQIRNHRNYRAMFANLLAPLLIHGYQKTLGI